MTPSYNQAAFLEETILSVLHQGYSDLEYIVIDGGSTDGSRKIIEQYADRLAYWESTPDRGQAHAINKGWARATGKYLWWLNADDRLAPYSVWMAVRFLESHPEIDFAYGDHLWIDHGGSPIREYTYPDFDYVRFELERPDVSQAGGLARAIAIERVGYLDEDLHYLMDLDYLRRMVSGGCRIARIPHTLAHFRIYDQSKTLAGAPRAVKERYLLHDRLFSRLSPPPSVRAGRSRVASRMHLYACRTYLLCGEYGSALKEGLHAGRAWPPQVLRWTFWYHCLLGLLGMVLGRKAWLLMRKGVRTLRRSPFRAPGSGRE